MVSEILRFHCNLVMMSSWFLRQGALRTIFHNGFWKSEHDFRIAIPSNFLSAMHGFRITRFYCQLDMTSSSVLRHTHFFMTDSEKATANSWLRSIITFYRGCMVSEITRFYCKPDMTSSSVLSQGALHHIFTQNWRNLNERPQFHTHGSLTYFAYLLPFRSYSTFYFGW